MSDLNHLYHGVHRLSHEKEHPRIAGLLLIVIGFVTAPMLVGIPILIYGIYKLVK